MFIKQLTIQGFKSYKDQTHIEPFSENHNVIVGRNGSGKSNAFWAVRFVLNDAYPNMTREERLSLLHEGTGQATLSAYVEIVFDNSDQRMPTGKDSVLLRRTIGLKKDEYSLDKKSVPKSEVTSLLESAGFSNPYYIVPQGKVTALCNAKESDRLQLLKEVSGTRVYEQRRQESLKIMQETDQKRTKISELLTYIEERLQELEEEKEELKSFYEHDKTRRCIEYTIYSREQHEISEQLEEWEDERRQELDGSHQRRAQAQEREREIQELEVQLKQAQEQLILLQTQRQQCDEDCREQVQQRAKLELTMKDAEKNNQNSAGEAQQLQKELDNLNAQISRKEEELNQLLPEYNERLAQEIDLQQQLDDSMKRKEQLQAKQGRAARFKDKKSRDEYLKTEILSLQKQISAQIKQKSALANDIKELSSKLVKLQNDAHDKSASVEDVKAELHKLVSDLKIAKQDRDKVYEQRKEYWRQDAQLVAACSGKKDEFRRLERSLGSTMDKATSSGLDAVRKIAERLKVSNLVYGPLYELFEVDEAYSTAVEITAGSSLFHVVVENDDVVSQILEVMNKEKSGRVTFMPLNRLQPPTAKYPDSAAQAIPMLSKVRHDPKYRRAFEQVFSKTIICPSLDVASELSKQYGLNAITLDGDKVERKGAMTGGYHDQRKSRLDSIRQLKVARQRLDVEQRRSEKVKQRLQEVEQECAQVQNLVTTMENHRRHLILVLDSQVDQKKREKEQLVLSKQLQLKEKSLTSLEGSSSQLQSQVDELVKEMATALNRRLESIEQKQLEALNTSLPKLSQQLADLSATRVQCEMLKNKLESELSVNLKRKRDDVELQLENLEQQGEVMSSQASLIGSAGVVQQQHDFDSCLLLIQQLSHTLADLDRSVETEIQRIRDLELDIETKNYTQQEDSRFLDQMQKHVERYLSKRTLLTQKKDDCIQKIRELGALHEDAYMKYQEISSKKLVKELHRVNEQLKKYGNVNKKAFEQFNNFNKQRDSLIKRKTDLDESAESIHKLIAHLDQRKDEAIERTFKHVEKAFSEIFEKLVPAGRGELLIHRREVPSQMDSQSQFTQEAQYVGIGMRVSFNSKFDEGLMIQQLSGGQKSLVALTLIFAIQRCDPAPFYLFDEIDANLDAQYRSSVAAMVNELSREAQFIVTTFRPEMLRYADKFYGVTFADRVSQISVITREEALNFVEQEAVV